MERRIWDQVIWEFKIRFWLWCPSLFVPGFLLPLIRSADHVAFLLFHPLFSFCLFFFFTSNLYILLRDLFNFNYYFSFLNVICLILACVPNVLFKETMTNSLSTLQSAVLQGPLAWIGIVQSHIAFNEAYMIAWLGLNDFNLKLIIFYFKSIKYALL